MENNNDIYVVQDDDTTFIGGLNDWQYFYAATNKEKNRILVPFIEFQKKDQFDIKTLHNIMQLNDIAYGDVHVYSKNKDYNLHYSLTTKTIK